MADEFEDKSDSRRRRNYLVDPDVQTALLRHMALGWIAVFAIIATVLLAVESYQSGFSLGPIECLAAMWNENAALVIAISILAPVMVYDSLRLSHRFVGPMVTFRRALANLGKGECVAPIQFRENDHWKDIADSFNRVIARIEQLETAKCDDESEPIAIEV